MPRKFVSPASLSAEERRLRSQLHQLLTRSPGMLHGSLIEMARRCGNPGCRCASDDAAKHRSLYLGQTSHAKTIMEYVPKSLEPTVRQWAQDFQLATKLLEELNLQGRNRLKAQKAEQRSAPAKNKAKPSARKPKSPRIRANEHQSKPPPPPS